MKKIVVGILFIIISCFKAEAYEGVTNGERLSALEAWKEQEVINNNRFHQTTWISTENKIERMEDKIAKINSQLAELDGLLKIFSVIAFFLNISLPIISTIIINKLSSNYKNDRMAIEIHELRELLKKEG
jgi:molybdopterin-guanine dinucleotide biosynthesis protein A